MRLSTLLTFLAAAPAGAHEIAAPATPGSQPAFDIVATEIAPHGDHLAFRIRVAAEAGASVPTPSGKLAGAQVYSYVWPTNLESASIGFDAAQGIVALAVTAHPDFDDTPLYDETGEGRTDNDGGLWHSHWVVLVEAPDCGPKALKVRDIPEGATPKLPETWPGLPLLIDSPDLRPEIGGDTVEVMVPWAAVGGREAARGLTFDGVTAGLRVNASVHAPLLCVTDVFDVASGDLSLPGRLED